jgi:hypothetical protein
MLAVPQTQHHLLFLSGIYVDRPGKGLKPRFVTIEPSIDADIAQVVQTISRRAIRKLRPYLLFLITDDTLRAAYAPHFAVDH